MREHEEPTNDERAEWADEALRAFAGETGQIASGDYKHDQESVLGDLLCDLLHLCDRDGMDFDRALKNGRSLYSEEVATTDDDRSNGPRRYEG